MKTVLPLLFALILPIILMVEVQAQPYAIGHLQETFTDSSRSNRSISCEVYYPALAGGNNTLPASGIFPVISFGHGFVMSWSVYDVFWQNLVPEGFILVFPTTESGFSPSHLNFGKDLAFLCNALRKEGRNPASVFYNKIDSTTAVMGHSMGGGAAFLAMKEDSSITALATLAAAETNPSAVSAAQSIGRPALVFSASNDCVTPPAQHQTPMYQSLSSSSKSFISISGGNHCQFASFNLNCSFGQSTCSPQATINAAVQQEKVLSLLLPWLRFYLKKVCAAGTEFQNLLNSSAGISNQQSGSLDCNATGLSKAEAEGSLRIFPNPAEGFLQTIIPESRSCGKKNWKIINLQGKTMLSEFLDGSAGQIRIESLPSGCYQLHTKGFPAVKFLKN